MNTSSRSGYIYLIRNTINGKGYVGQTRQTTVQGRWTQHLRAAKGGSDFALHCAIRKYGLESFTVSELAFGPNSLLDSLEIVFIYHFNTFTLTGHGYNMTEGGGGICGWKNNCATDEWRRKQRESHLGQQCSEETRAKLRAAHARRTHYPKRGPETGAKISARLTGGKLSEETRKRMSESRRKRPGRPMSEETKAKQREARYKYLERTKNRVL